LTNSIKLWYSVGNLIKEEREMKKKTNIVIQFIFGDDKVLEFEDFDDALHYLVGYIFSVRNGVDFTSPENRLCNILSLGLPTDDEIFLTRQRNRLNDLFLNNWSRPNVKIQ
jgi:hypothetical protein